MFLSFLARVARVINPPPWWVVVRKAGFLKVDGDLRHPPPRVFVCWKKPFANCSRRPELEVGGGRPCPHGQPPDVRRGVGERGPAPRRPLAGRLPLQELERGRGGLLSTGNRG